MSKQIVLILFTGFCSIFLISGNALAQAFCGAYAYPPSHPRTAPTDGMGNFFACESGALDIAFKQPNEPNGNLPDNFYIMEFSNNKPLLANKTGMWSTVEQGLIVGDTVFISVLTLDIDSLNGLLDKANSLCPFLVIPGSREPCKKVKDIQNGENDNMPGVQNLDEIISIAESFSGEQIVDLERTVEVLRKFNKNIESFGGQICFTRSYPPLVVHIVEDGPTCFQGDVDGDLVDNILEDTNKNNDLTDDDLDNDGIPNYLDEDDNNDGILTKDHDLDNNGDPTDDDSNGDGTPDYLEFVPVGIIDKTVQALVYPNPNYGVFYVDLSKKINQLKAFDTLGKEVDVNLTGNQVYLNEGNSGVYVLQINEHFVKIFVK